MTSLDMRSNTLFMRNEFENVGKWQIPLIRKQEIDVNSISLIACSDTRTNDNSESVKCGVHFFVDDYRFEGIYRNPERSLEKFSQYAFLLPPDNSTYAEMGYWRQLESVAHSRWVGAYWQSKGLTVIPTVTWSDVGSYSFCFDGIVKTSIVAVGMIGCKGERVRFLRGYNAMLEKIEPSAVICYGNPFPEMDGNIITVSYSNRERRAS